MWILIYYFCLAGDTEILRLLASASMQFPSTPKNCMYCISKNINKQHIDEYQLVIINIIQLQFW